MESLRLVIPPLAQSPAAKTLAQPAKLKVWLESLSLGNSAKTGHDLLTTLYQVNRAILAVAQRYKLLEQLRPVVADVLDTLSKQYITAFVPLGDKQRATADLTHALLTEMAYGYKTVLLTLATSSSKDSFQRKALIAAAIQTVNHQARLLADSYALYAPEPANLWLELHQTYRYAEHHGFHLEEVTNEKGIASIDHTYRRILLLALTKPYQLMQGETLQMYHELDEWIAGCRIIPLSGNIFPRGHPYVDLEGDAPPRFASSSLKFSSRKDVRQLDISGALEYLEQRTKTLAAGSKTEVGRLSLAARKRRNMYKRVREAWGMRSERLSERKRRDALIQIAVGVSACHYHCSWGAAFTPEASEIELRKEGKNADLGLSLISGETPWGQEVEHQDLAGDVLPRTSQFAGERPKEPDMWVKVHSTQIHIAPTKDTATAYASAACQIRDESPGGIAVVCKREHGIRLTVGEVIAHKSAQSPSPHDWSIATVRWLQTTADHKMELGIRILADNAMPVATRGIQGVGKGSEYFRSLLVPKLDPVEYPTTLITPAAVYDVESIVLINTGDRLLHAHLTKLLEATNAYSLFQFRLVDIVTDTKKKASTLSKSWGFR